MGYRLVRDVSISTACSARFRAYFTVFYRTEKGRLYSGVLKSHCESCGIGVARILENKKIQFEVWLPPGMKQELKGLVGEVLFNKLTQVRPIFTVSH